MASEVSPRDVPKDERSSTKNAYNDLAVGDRIKFSLPELEMQCTNAEVVKLTPVSAAVASRASKGCGKLMNTPAPLVVSSQVSSAPQYDKHGHARYWVTVKAARQRLARKYLMSDEKFVRIATSEQVRQVPTTTVPHAWLGHN
jgi:hypothetical protein